MEGVLAGVSGFWGWLALALIFLAVEALVAPVGFFLSMGTAAGVVALVAFVAPGLSWLWTVSLFSLLAVVAGYGWWRFVRGRGAGRREDADTELNEKSAQLMGYRGFILEDMRAGRGRMMVNDSPWRVSADEDFPAGTEVEVTAVSGVTLRVKRVG